jgi:hypothetical protein
LRAVSVPKEFAGRALLQLHFSFALSAFARQTPTVRQLTIREDDLAVNLNRTQILGALILAAIALAILLARWKLAH